MLLGFYLKTHCQTQDHLEFSLFYHLEVLEFYILLRSVIHLALILVKDIRQKSRLFFLSYNVQLSPYHLLKRFYLPLFFRLFF